MATEELKKILKNAVTKGDFILTSGRKSSYYVDIKKVSTNPSSLKKIAKEMAVVLKNIKVDKIAGVAIGGVPIAVALSLETNIPYLIIRKEKRTHGTEGKIEGELLKGEKVVVVEDVTTTGSSVLEAVKAIREKGECNTVIVVVDRKEGALELLEKNGIKFIALAIAEELI